jgi:hypothetical protein
MPGQPRQPQAPNLFGDLNTADDAASTDRPKGKYYGGIADDYVYVEPQRDLNYAGNAAGGFRDDAKSNPVRVPTYKTENDDDFRILQGMGTEALISLQEALNHVGLIKDSAVIARGRPDATTRKAFREVLGYANQNGFDDQRGGWRAALMDYAANGASRADGVSDLSGGAAKQVKPGNATRLTAGLDLESQVQTAAQTRLGRKLRKNEIQKFISIYHGLETKTAATMAAGDDRLAAGQDVTVTDAPNAGVSATNFVDTNMATEAGAHDVANVFDTFKSLIGAG